MSYYCIIGGNMNFTSIRYKQERMQDKIPDFFIKTAQAEETQFYGAWDDDGIYILLMVTPGNNDKTQVIRYIYFAEDAHKRLFADLMQYVEKACRKKDIERILVEQIGTAEELDRVKEWLIDAGYVLDSSDNTYMVYELDGMRQSTFFEKVTQAKALLKNVFFYNQLTKEQLLDFSYRMENLKRDAKYVMPDLVFGCYYVDEDEIKGFIDIAEVEEGVLELKDVCLDIDKHSKYAFPAMLAKSLVTTTVFLAEGTIVRMKLNQSNLCNGVKTAFGDANYEGVIYEYSKNLY